MKWHSLLRGLRFGLVLSTLAIGCGSSVESLPGAQGDLLAGRSPIKSSGVQHAPRLTDGFTAKEGAFWRTDVTAVVGSGAFALWDLGETRAIECALLQGDNNDWYELQGSEDGQSFSPLWTANPTPRAGMQLRLEQHVGGKARFVRLTARGGDGLYSVGELALFSTCATEWPPRLVARDGASDETNVMFKLLGFGVLSILFLLLNRKNGKTGKDWMRFAIAAPIGVGLSAFVDLAAMWPFDEMLQTPIRAVVAGIAAVLVFREYAWPRLYPVSARATTAALA